MLQVMSSLERQVAEYTTKENKMNSLVKESKIKIEESLRTRDQAVARDIQNQKEIARLLEDRKKLQNLKNIEIDEAVEKTRIKFGLHIKSMENELNEIIEKNSQLRGMLVGYSACIVYV